MDLKLATVSSCVVSGCRVQLIEGGTCVEAGLAGPVVDNEITIRPGDVVAVDCAVDPPEVVFRLVLTSVQRMEAGQAVVRGPCGLADAVPLADWLQGEVAAGDPILIAFAEVHDVARDGRPAHPDRLRATLFPRIEAMYERLAASQGLDPRRVVEEGYDRIGERYSEWAEAVQSPERARYTSILLERLPAGAQVLDLGCGAGVPTTLALARRFKVTGVDISTRQIERARRNVPSASFIRADVTRFNLPPASLDGVAAFYSLIHMPREEHAGLLARIAGWLRPGGILVATMGVHPNQGAFDDLLDVPMYWSGFGLQANRSLVEAAGLEVVSAEERLEAEFGPMASFFWVVARKPGGQAAG